MKIISKDKKQKMKNVHHSIKTQMITSFVGLLICLVVTLMFINGKFLEPYYISKKESRFIELYEKLNDVSNEDKWDSTKKNNSLIHFAEKNNISYLVIEKDNDVHTNVHDKNMLKNQMMGYFLNQAQKKAGHWILRMSIRSTSHGIRGIRVIMLICGEVWMTAVSSCFEVR